MLLIKSEDHVHIQTKNCGEIIEILTRKDYGPLGIAICVDIQKTEGHFHKTFEEIYFLLDGEMTLLIYDPRTQDKQTIELKQNELFLVEKGVHHKVIAGSKSNRLCAITVPPFEAGDEYISDVI